MIDRRDFIKLVSIGMILGISNPLIAKTFDKTIIKNTLNNDSIKTLPTGIKSLDEKIGGLQSGSLTIIAGRPAMGKSLLALNIARHVGKELARPVAYFSLEMSRKELAMRMLSIDTKVDSNIVMKGYISKENWQKISLAANEMAKAPIFIDDSSSLTTLDLKSKTEKLKKEYGISLIIVDYLQLMGDKSRFTHILDFSKTIKSLKKVAQELNVPVIVLSQLPHWIENRTPPKPEINDLGELAQYADNVMLLYRESVYSKPKVSEEEKLLEIIIAKTQKGSTGNIVIPFFA